MGLQAFTMLDARVVPTILIGDGNDAGAGEVLAELTGPARALLTGERTCLNLLGHLSGIATATREAVALVAGTGARIVDTRKTTPGLRAFEKYAVRCGGGGNHRFGLHDGVMIKDNHIAAAGSIAAAVAAVKAGVGHMLKIEVELDHQDQIPEALEAGADVILLDNMTPRELAAAVALVDGAALTEASGSITAHTVGAVAASGVDIISMGALTHSAPRLDVAMEM
jgi:nicotinate-nucleotide pyrophosphorylase (carboxylating)